MTCAGIVLAGGASSRMGSPKALLEFRGETFLDRLTRLLGQCCSPVLVVLGYHAEAVRRGCLHPEAATFITNPAPELGQLSSLQTGLKALEPRPDAVMVTLVDCPAVEQETVRRLYEGHAHAANEVPFTIPRIGARHGHPIVFSARLIDEFLHLPSTSEARSVVHSYVDRTQYIDVEDAGILRDVDDRAAYHALLKEQESR